MINGNIAIAKLIWDLFFRWWIDIYGTLLSALTGVYWYLRVKYENLKIKAIRWYYERL